MEPVLGQLDDDIMCARSTLVRVCLLVGLIVNVDHGHGMCLSGLSGRWPAIR